MWQVFYRMKQVVQGLSKDQYNVYFLVTIFRIILMRVKCASVFLTPKKSTVISKQLDRATWENNNKKPTSPKGDNYT